MSPSPVHRSACFACRFCYAVSLRFLHFLLTAEPGSKLVRKKDKSSFVPLSSICNDGKQMYEKVWCTFSHAHSRPDTFCAGAKTIPDISLLFTHENGDFSAISVTDRSCLAPIWGFSEWMWNNLSKYSISPHPPPPKKNNLTSFETVLNPNL